MTCTRCLRLLPKSEFFLRREGSFRFYSKVCLTCRTWAVTDYTTRLDTLRTAK